jgi:UDP-N-acetylmuramate: L-alanyl-gamma-D-glutamyl-meso-diaminopimelate ligase
MHLHILGIGGTFMSALALFARAKGFTVTGNDSGVYPPISDLLLQEGIAYHRNYEDMQAMLAADLVVVGNAMKRGMPIVEALLNHSKSYVSGPEWLAQHVLKDYRVLAVAGTHGKTSTSTIAAYILEQAGLKPGYLIGGVPQVLDSSAKLGEGEWLVIEADEYDSAFFDKRPKFMHYRPEGAILHNLEFDHADIYDSLGAIQKQFHYLMRSLPAKGWIVRPKAEVNLDVAMQMGVYSPIKTWGVEGADLILDPKDFRFVIAGETIEVNWSLLGRHNIENAVAAILACGEIGVEYAEAAKILETYQPVKRRLEICYQTQNLTVYDDFAHHPTAILKSSAAVADSGKHERVIGVLDFASNSMRTGEHLAQMPAALHKIDLLYVLDNPNFDMQEVAKAWPCPVKVAANVEGIIESLKQDQRPKDAILLMSNKGFGDLKQKLLARLH